MTNAMLLRRPTPGINHPVCPEPETVRDLLEEENRDLVRRRDQLLDAVARVPETIDTDEVCGRASDFVKQIGAAAKTAEARRTEAKGPYVAAEKAVDGFFRAQLGEPLAQAKLAIQRRVDGYLRAKAAQEHRRREEEARRAAAAAKAREAAILAAEIPEEAADAALDAAILAQEAAEEAAREVAAKPADLSRTRGDYGAVASLRTSWAFEVEDLHAIPLDALRPYFTPDAVEKALRAYVRAGGRQLAGVRIFQQSSAVVR
jgi:hypothetical protein